MVAFRIFLTIPYGYSKAPLTFCLWRSVRFHSQREEKIRIVKSGVSPGGRNGWRDVRQSGEGLTRAGCFFKRQHRGQKDVLKSGRGDSNFMLISRGRWDWEELNLKGLLVLLQEHFHMDSMKSSNFSKHKYSLLSLYCNKIALVQTFVQNMKYFSNNTIHFYSSKSFSS